MNKNSGFELVWKKSDIEWDKGYVERMITITIDLVKKQIWKIIKCVDKDVSRIIRVSQNIPIAFIKYRDYKYYIEWESNILKDNWWIKSLFNVIDVESMKDALATAKNMPINTSNWWIYRTAIYIKINEHITLSPSIWYDKLEDIYSVFFMKVNIKRTMANYINWLVSMSCEKDPETWEHQNRLSAISEFLWNKLNEANTQSHKINKHKVKDIWLTAHAHDIWKVWINEDILGRKWKLSAEEFEKVKTHTTRWAKQINLLKERFWEYYFIDTALNITKYHHEKYDWSWYPEWLEWENIPIEARIVAIADVFDALKSKRPYKEAFDDDKTKEILLEWRWTHFDPIILDIFLENYDKINKIRDKIKDREIK